jgi:hypothetical protein
MRARGERLKGLRPVGGLNPLDPQGGWFVLLAVTLFALGVLSNWWLIERPRGFMVGEPAPVTYRIRTSWLRGLGVKDVMLGTAKVLLESPEDVLSPRLLGLIMSMDGPRRGRIITSSAAVFEMAAAGRLDLSDRRSVEAAIWSMVDRLQMDQGDKNVVFQVVLEVVESAESAGSVGSVIAYEGQMINDGLARLLMSEGYRDRSFPWKRFAWSLLAVMAWSAMSWSLFSRSTGGRDDMKPRQWRFVLSVVILCWGVQLVLSFWLMDLMFPAALASWLFLTLPVAPAFGLSLGWGIVGAIICFVYFPPLAAVQVVQAVLSSGLGYVLLKGSTSRLSLLGRLVSYFALIAVASIFVRWGFGAPMDMNLFLTYGVLSLLWPSLILALLPLWERLFGVISPLMLMELSHPSSALLKRLQLEAPGTYHHCLTVGTIAEEAAERLGLEGLLVRAGAYYHDIGKLRRPKFFIENQVGENVHDGLSPSLSALVILSHVKDGLEMADQYGLPDFVKDFISEHHGTTCLAYFYRKAKSMGEDVPIEQFSYPGPPPQSRETALVMLADSVEAAAKSMGSKLDDPSELEGMVEEVIKSKLDSHQLDQVDFTIQDMRIIRDSFVKTLRSMRHTRAVRPV